MSLADFSDAAAAAQHVKAVMLAYPRTNAIILREAGILCWGLMTHAQVGPQAILNIQLTHHWCAQESVIWEAHKVVLGC